MSDDKISELRGIVGVCEHNGAEIAAVRTEDLDAILDAAEGAVAALREVVIALLPDKINGGYEDAAALVGMARRIASDAVAKAKL